jgi:hypothetical protein
MRRNSTARVATLRVGSGLVPGEAGRSTAANQRGRDDHDFGKAGWLGNSCSADHDRRRLVGHGHFGRLCLHHVPDRGPTLACGVNFGNGSRAEVAPSCAMGRVARLRIGGMRRWQIYLLLAAAALVAALSGHSLFVATIQDLNEHISRCSDESAAQYIADRDQRRRECGLE